MLTLFNTLSNIFLLHLLTFGNATKKKSHACYSTVHLLNVNRFTFIFTIHLHDLDLPFDLKNILVNVELRLVNAIKVLIIDN